jgi:M6 family metalloprotease-like protein
MNHEGYNGVGSFKDFYHEVSYDQLTVNTVVTQWVTVPGTHDSYASDWGLFTRHAVDAAEAAGIDFSQFDNDNDGWVDGIAVIHQGTGQEASGDPTDIWSHSSSLMYSGYEVEYDGVIVNAYTSQPEIYSGNISTIGVMCHEFGHNLGAPDFYDTDYEAGGSHVGTGRWDVMAGGSWNGDPAGSRPPHHNPLMVMYLGWGEFTSLDDYSEPTWLTLSNSNESPQFYIIETQTPNEYFILENRQQIGFNASSPGHGMVVYHFDEDFVMEHAQTNEVNTTDHQGFYPRAYNNAINTTYCPLPGTYNINSFHDWSNPNSVNWAGLPTNKPITNITESTEGEIQFYYLDTNVPYTTCSIIEPVEGSLILPGEDIHMTIDAWNSLGAISSVEISLNGQLSTTLNQEPWEYTFPATGYSGQILLGVRTEGVDGSWAEYEHYIEVVNPIAIVAEDFEGMNNGDFTIDRWTLIDQDETANVIIPGFDVPYEGGNAGFFIFDNRNFGDAGISALSGYHTLAVLKAENAPNDDWLISPLLHIEGGSYAQFHHRSYSGNNQPMEFEVLISGGSADPAEFFNPSGETTVLSDNDWSMFRIMLTSYSGQNIRIAVHCISENAGELMMIDNFMVLSAAGQVSNEEIILIPPTTGLESNYPNPFNPETTISYSLSEAVNAELSIYNILGQKVNTLQKGFQNEGRHTILWRGTDSRGKAVPSGIYFYKLTAGTYTMTRKMILLK